jgi:hypothetical protein
LGSDRVRQQQCDRQSVFMNSLPDRLVPASPLLHILAYSAMTPVLVWCRLTLPCYKPFLWDYQLAEVPA